MKSNGFSLIELMVVIAIVALLAAVAIPSYKDYAVKTRIVATVAPVIDTLKPQIINYYTQFGAFPQAADLGIGTTYNVNNPTNYGSNITLLRVVKDSATCSRIIVAMTGAALGRTFNDTFGYISGGNGLTYTNWIYDDGSGNLKTACGSEGNVLADYAYLPAGCSYGQYGGSGIPTGC